ncbi:MAG TPA: hypothetical protein VLV78_09190 [Thermoanaerobaculia bacterium]|nr:hypothetical protein [Thermoanaerobaculia bacterium]
MARRDLLPGVKADRCPPMVAFDSRRAIVRARRHAAACDVAQLILLAGVDWMFVRWPYSHVPLIGRPDSVLVLAALNALLLTHVVMTRMFPRWSARRIATTWSLSERARFFMGGWDKQARQ